METSDAVARSGYELASKFLNRRPGLFHFDEIPELRSLEELGRVAAEGIRFAVAENLASPSSSMVGRNYEVIAILLRLLGRQKDRQATRLLVAVASDHSTVYEFREIRQAAVWALGELGDAQVIPMLKGLRNRRDVSCQAEVVASLRKLGELVNDAQALLAILVGRGYERESNVETTLAAVADLEPRLSELNQEERGTFWYVCAYVARMFRKGAPRLREYCLRSLAEDMERPVLWEWIEEEPPLTRGRLLEAVAEMPGLEDLAKKINSGGLRPASRRTTVFAFFTNSTIPDRTFVRRVPVEEWAALVREALSLPEADVLVFDYNDWDCPPFNDYSQREINRLEDKVKKGIREVLEAYGVPFPSAGQLIGALRTLNNDVSQRFVFIAEHRDYHASDSPALRAIRELSDFAIVSPGYAAQAWTPLARRGIKRKFLSPKYIGSVGVGAPCRALAALPIGQRVFYGTASGSLNLYDFAAYRLINTYAGHNGAVNSIAVSPDSEWAVSGGDDRTVRVWHVEAKFQGSLLVGADSTVLVVSPDRDTTTSATTLPLGRSYPAVAVLIGHRKAVNSVAISPDSKWLLSGSADETIRVWDREGKRCIRTITAHRGGVNAVLFSPDARQIVSAGNDKTLKIWDLTSGACQKSIPVKDNVTTLSVLAGREVLVSGSETGKLEVWRLAGAETMQLSALADGLGLAAAHEGAVTGLCVQPADLKSGGLLSYRFSAGVDCFVRSADLIVGAEVFRLKSDGAVHAVALSPDGHHLLSGGDDGKLQITALHWEYEFPPLVDWNEGAETMLLQFLRRQTPYAVALGERTAPEEITNALRRKGKPQWTDNDFHNLLVELGWAGFGWLTPTGVRGRLERLSRERVFDTEEMAASAAVGAGLSVRKGDPDRSSALEWRNGRNVTDALKSLLPPAFKRQKWWLVFAILLLGGIVSVGLTLPQLQVAMLAAPTPAATRVRETDGALMVWIPAGEFMMGSIDADGQAYGDEKPQSKIGLHGYWMDRTEVTNAQYRKFVEAGGYRSGEYWSEAGWIWKNQNYVTQPDCWGNGDFNQPEQPVVCVSWYEAFAYASWANGRLPTEAEWEKAARGTDRRTYPWGELGPNDQLLNFNGRIGRTTPVGAYPRGASPYGVLDMAGNVSEWVSSEFKDYPYDSSDGRESPDGTSVRAMRGGYWSVAARYVRSASRGRNAPGYRGHHLGFRVAFSDL